MSVALSPTHQLIVSLSTSPALTPLMDDFDDLIAVFLNRIDQTEDYAKLDAELSPEAHLALAQYALRLNGVVTDAFLAGLLCAHTQVVAG